MDIASNTHHHLEPRRYTASLRLSGLRDVVIDGGGQAEFWRAGIELTGCRVVTIRGLTFRQAPATTIAFLGDCAECTVEDCAFLACGIPGGGVTVWLGERTRAITVRGCQFDMLGARGQRHLRAGSHCYDIGIMTAQQECTEHRILTNRLTQYSYGIQLGTFAAENTLVARNALLDCGGADVEPCAAVDCAGILLFTTAAQRVGKNRIVGTGAAVVQADRPDPGVSLTGRGPT